MFSTLRKTIAVVLLAVFCGLASCRNVTHAANVNNFYFKDFTADYYLSRDNDGMSRLRVVEHLLIEFPNYNQNHGFTRIIPFTNNDGKTLTMASDRKLNIQIEHNGVEEAPANIEAGDGYFIVYVGDGDKYVHGEQSYTLTYEFQNVILSFTEDDESWQELYWDTNGNDSSQRFDSVTARLHIDPDIQDNFDGRVACYVGNYGADGSDRCDISAGDDYIEFSAQDLTSYEGLTFALGFDADTFAKPKLHYNYAPLIFLVIEILSSSVLIILIILAVKSTNEKRHYYKNLFIKPEYTPPHGYTVAEMLENYIGSGVKGNSKVATLLELATSHKIELIKDESQSALGRKKTKWQLRILSTEDLSKEQVIVLKILAGSATELEENQTITIKSRTANSTLISLAEKYQKEIEKSLIAKGLSEDFKSKASTGNMSKSKRQPNYPSGLAVATAIWMILIIIALLALEDIFYTPPYLVDIGAEYFLLASIIYAIVIIITSFMISIKTHKYYHPTMKGLDYSRYLDGLKMYIKMAEAERLQFLQSVDGADLSNTGVVKLYEKLLPYATAFGLEKSWLAEMGKYYELDDVPAPDWYLGASVFSAAEFSRALNSMTMAASSSIAHSTTSSSSSSSSGFSGGGGGGGFSGGGGGGGGFGGW